MSSEFSDDEKESEAVGSKRDSNMSKRLKTASDQGQDHNNKASPIATTVQQDAIESINQKEKSKKEAVPKVKKRPAAAGGAANRPRKRARAAPKSQNHPDLVLTLLKLDPILQFLTRATGKPLVPLKTIQSALPVAFLASTDDKTSDDDVNNGSSPQKQGGILLHHVRELHERGILHLVMENDDDDLQWTSQNASLGFPPPPSMNDGKRQKVVAKNGTLHGSSKTAAKRRLTALRQSLKDRPGAIYVIKQSNDKMDENKQDDAGNVDQKQPSSESAKKDWDNAFSKPGLQHQNGNGDNDDDDYDDDEPILQEAKEGRKALLNLLNLSRPKKSKGAATTTPFPAKTRHSLNQVLPKQASYAGSNPARKSVYGQISESCAQRIPTILFDALDLERPNSDNKTDQNATSCRKKLYHHQAVAIESALKGHHTLVCTGTGSGKSLCFLLPILTLAYEAASSSSSSVSLLLFPTKALAQDQLTKLNSLLSQHGELAQRIRPGIIDGDTHHAQRTHVAKECNIILTNPDTLHAAILPGWKQASHYKQLLGRVQYIVIDEAHMYEGVFGAHVAMVLSRLVRLVAAAAANTMSKSDTDNNNNNIVQRIPTFLACSATLPHPEHHVRLLFPIPQHASITVLAPEDDGSPRAAKHFFVWNPPILDLKGMSTGQVTMPKPSNEDAVKPKVALQQGEPLDDDDEENKTHRQEAEEFLMAEEDHWIQDNSARQKNHPKKSFRHRDIQLYRRHAADETALLLTRAVTQGVRCIAFCKTRCLVEWVYERCISALKSDPATEHLAHSVESYRGGYTAEARRCIESRLFRNDLLGVVGTSALELGVDIGGIDLTLHCGYPSSYASLLQQAGRAGRGKARLHVPSIAIMVPFNSPAEQHLWRFPQNLLSKRLTGLVSMPINVGLVQGHLLCAGEEYPLAGEHPVARIFQLGDTPAMRDLLSDHELFGGKDIFVESVNGLMSTGLMKKDVVPISSTTVKEIPVYKTHPFVNRPWTKVNLRSIEPINYAIVDLTHPMQRGQTDGIKDERAILDTIPYSRVFYHAFPGAIITHRGTRYKVQSMTRPPAFADSATGYCSGINLAAYAKPTSARYMTRPLSTMSITVIKIMDRIDLTATEAASRNANTKPDAVAPSIEQVYGNGRDNAMAQEYELTRGSLAGNGALNVRRTVHGYKKLSPITRMELSRTEISLPAMEFDTFGFWIDAEASALSDVVKNYDEGVHALSHAILAVAPLFVPCTTSDINCDHTVYNCTRVAIFDMRAGGTGTSALLWKYLFVPDGLLDAAIKLMENCNQCHNDKGYDGGCPACLQFGQCLRFNQSLSRSAAIVIGKRMLKRIQETELYKYNVMQLEAEQKPESGSINVDCSSPDKHVAFQSSPTQEARRRAMKEAQDLKRARERQVVVGRPSWPMDTVNGPALQQVEGD